MSTFEITIQRQSKNDDSYPVVAEYTRTDSLLSPIRSEGGLRLDEDIVEELATLALERQAYGTVLGELLFRNDIRYAFRDALKASRDESDDRLRVLLVVEDETLRPLHWERLCGPIGTGANRWDFLALDEDILYAMYLPSLSDKHFRAIGRRDLRALIVVANPLDGEEYDLAPFDAEATIKGVEASLGGIEYDVLGDVPGNCGQATFENLISRLSEPHYTVLHIVAHGMFRAKDGETILYLTDDDKKLAPITASKLIKRLGRLRGMPHFAFFSTCESADPGAEKAGALGGMAQRLVRELGVPAVVAMTEQVAISTANALADNFYERLHEHGQVDRALVEAGVSLARADDVVVAALYTRLGGRPLFSDEIERDLTAAEIEYGLDRLKRFLPERAPILRPVFASQAAAWRSVLIDDKEKLSDQATREWENAEAEINTMCEEVLDLNFRALALDQKPPRYDSRQPFPGLLAFQAKDRDFFFGREAIVNDLCRRLQAHPFLAVLGASGSGKSSLVLAGLVPEIKAQMLYMTPGSDPLANLRSALAGRDDAQAQVLVVDQFEELFTHCPDSDQRRAFIDQLLDLIDGGPDLKVIVTMRADFWGECAPYPKLKAAMQQHQELLAPMTTAELRSAMEQQANQVGLRFEADLSYTILAEVEDEPGAMPLLQHLLQEMWRRRYGRWLRASEYRNLGGIKRAIALTADELYTELKATGHATQTREIFTRLTRVEKEPGPDGTYRDTRQRVTRADLIGRSEDAAEIRQLISRLAGARLVVTRLKSGTEQLEGDDAGIDDSQVEVEVSHEALIRHWDRLRRWINDSRQILVLEREIREDAVEWAAAESDEARQDQLLYRGGRLEDIQKWLAAGLLRLGEQAMDYINACAEFEAQRIEELRQLLDEAEVQRSRAEEQADLALSRQLAAQAMTILDRQFDQALLLALTANQIADTVEARGSLMAGVAHQPYLITFLHGHESWVGALTFSPDDNKVISAAADGGVMLWDVTSRQALSDMSSSGSGNVGSMAFSPDGQTAALGGDKGAIILWDLQAGRSLGAPLAGHKGSVTGLTFSPDGGTLASSGSDTRIMLWDVANGRPLSPPLTGHQGGVSGLIFSPDGKILASGSDDKHIILWDVASRKPVAEPLAGHLGRVASLAFSPNGQTLASGGDDWSLILWDVAGRQPLGEPLRGHIAGLTHVAFSPDGGTVASSSWDRTVRLWEVDKQQVLGQPLRGHGGATMCVAFSSNGRTLASGSTDKRIILWDVDGRQGLDRPLSVPGGRYHVNDLAFSPDGQTLVVGSEDKTVILVDMTAEEIEGKALAGHTESVSCVALSPDGQMLASGSNDETIMLWAIADGRPVARPLAGHGARIAGVAFSPDGKTLYSGGRDGIIMLWDVTGGQFLGQFLDDHSAGILHLALAPDGTILATASSDGSIMLWDVAGRQPLGKPFGGHDDWISHLAFSPDGRTLATAIGNGLITLWDITSPSEPGAPVQRLEGHVGSVYCVSFSPDGQTLASGSDDQTIIIWDVVRGQLLGRALSGHNWMVTSLAFSPDGRILATGSAPQDVRLWAVDFVTWKARAQQRANRNLTQEEWDRFIGHDRPYEASCPDLPGGE